MSGDYLPDDDDIVADDDVAREQARWYRLARTTGASDALQALLSDDPSSAT